MNNLTDLSIEEIAEQEGISVGQALTLLRRLRGYKKRGPKQKLERDMAIETAYVRDHKSVAEIAEHQQITRQRVYQILNKMMGLCVYCDEEAAFNSTRCEKHIILHRQQQGGRDARVS